MSSLLPELSGNLSTIQTQAQRAYETAVANVSTQKAQTLQQYGYNPDGTLDSGNQYGLYQQLQNKYQQADQQLGDQRSALDTQYGITEGADGQFSVNSGGDGAYQRLAQNRGTALADINTDRTSRTKAAGLDASYDANGNPLGLDIAATPYGGYQQLLDTQGQQLTAAERNAGARGLGGKGLGAQGASDLRFAQGGDRQNYRTQLLDQLTNDAQQQRNTETTFSRGTTDANNAVTQALHGFTETAAQNKYGKGVDTLNLGTNLTGTIDQLTQQALQAKYDRDATISSASLQDILARIANGDFTGGGTTPGDDNNTDTTDGRPTVPTPAPLLGAATKSAPNPYGGGGRMTANQINARNKRQVA